MPKLITRRRVVWGLGGIAGLGILDTAGLFAEDRYSRFFRGARSQIRDHATGDRP